MVCIFLFAICFVVPLYRFLVIGCHIFGAPDATLLRCCIDYWRYGRSLYQPFCKGQVAVVFLATFYSLIPNKNLRYRVSYVWEFFFCYTKYLHVSRRIALCLPYVIGTCYINDDSNRHSSIRTCSKIFVVKIGSAMANGLSANQLPYSV